MTNTILVNKDNKIKSPYQKKLNLIKIENFKDDEIYIEEETYKSYLLLKKKLQEKNIEIGIISSYLDNPTSDHITGLAIDITIKIDNKYIEKENLIDYEDILKTIHSYLPEYGFILRYPKNKEAITGEKYTPWHIRYVGCFVAKILAKEDYTLEEYHQNFSKIIVVNKEKNMTSFDVVNYLQKLFGLKRIGHTGTLDPLAEGVLIVTIGKATKVAELLTKAYKEYEAEAILGIETDTLDITGKVLKEDKNTSTKNLDKVIKDFKKTYLQEVPMYSAVKVNGKKLYEYAREGKIIEPPKKEVTIKDIKLLSVNNNTFRFSCIVSKGCYIRSLIKDIGKSLNTYATMSKLTRTRQYIFSKDDSYTLKQIENNNFKMYNIEEVLEYPKIIVTDELARKIRTGQKLKDIYQINDKVIFLDKNKTLLGIYEKDNEILRVWKNFC